MVKISLLLRENFQVYHTSGRFKNTIQACATFQKYDNDVFLAISQ